MWSPSDDEKGARAAIDSLRLPCGDIIGESPVNMDTMVTTSSLSFENKWSS